jgi:hypothetical protein
MKQLAASAGNVEVERFALFVFDVEDSTMAVMLP